MGDSIVRHTEEYRALNNGDNVVVCFPGATNTGCHREGGTNRGHGLSR